MSETQAPAAAGPLCRHCQAPLSRVFCDLRATPPSNSFLRPEDLSKAEASFPLTTYVCDSCTLVQLPEHASAEAIFDDYVYFSSFSESWLAHARAYCDMIVGRLGLGPESLVVELASNDGYLLQYLKARGIPILGIDPSHTVAAAAEKKGVPTVVDFFGTRLAARLKQEGKRPDLILGNNVLAHVPDVNDFVAGMALLLAPGGVVTMEFPHVVRLVEGMQFDTIYHEHFSYFSLHTAERIFAAQGLTVFDVEEIPTHGGSLRIYARHAAHTALPVQGSVASLKARERAGGYDRPEGYAGFEDKVRKVKRDLLRFLIDLRESGATIAGYGAPAKGNTLLNYCGVGTDLLDFTVDRNPMKQGRYLPGVRIPVKAPEAIHDSRPDYVLILPWNIREEVIGQLAFIREWGGRFVVPIPRLEIVP
ncbi:class I SAM-dependent methyltransferase [Enterovirga sp.]|uniref:class I SAM-dependent methyltransferase n=1 Tax=Enterovirga sp. TaxID=2026350 RepID=UPI002607F6AC|nr:class I SAM-dependent methyltransferase [Enterovirga sp.]MDB5589615.1 2-polyprenyl-3-methyl-5-hydroxy-6-metoxy,4-benzoquinol methylase [Enterovirga sp.]